MNLTPEQATGIQTALAYAHKRGYSIFSTKTALAAKLGISHNPISPHESLVTVDSLEKALAAQPTVFHQDPGADSKAEAAHHDAPTYPKTVAIIDSADSTTYLTEEGDELSTVTHGHDPQPLTPRELALALLEEAGREACASLLLPIDAAGKLGITVAQVIDYRDADGRLSVYRDATHVQMGADELRAHLEATG